MPNKAEVLKQLERIHEDEPLFLLRGQDMVASRAVRGWICLASVAGAHPAKREGAEECAKQMDEWGFFHGVKVPD